MDEKALQSLIRRTVLTELARTGETWVPVMSSGRHCHLSQQDVERLFGPGYRLTKLRDLEQPGQFACQERVVLMAPKGRMTLRVVGPARGKSQVEISMTDAVTLGLKPPVRMSGDLAGSPGCTLVNGERSVNLEEGVIVAARHLHLSPEEAQAYGLKDGDKVSLIVDGPRAAVLKNVVVRSGPGHVLEAHIDRDEANACALRDGQLCRIERENGAAPAQPAPARTGPVPADEPKMLDLSGKERTLLTEDDVRQAMEQGVKRIMLAGDAIVTPLARETANDKGILLLVRAG